MKCPECQTENPEAKRFCRDCGAELPLVCPQCNAEILPDDKFCGDCGHTLAKTPGEEPSSTFEGERKHATVLFSDLSGYTALTEKIDPEEVKEIMSRIFGEIALVVEEYEGVVERFFGEIRGVRFRDSDGDGIREGDPGLASLTMYLDLNDNDLLDAQEPTTLTMSDDPLTIGIDETGVVYIADTWNRRIQALSSDGIFRHQWGVPAWGSDNPDEKPFLSLGAGLVFASDPVNRRVLAFIPDGTFQWALSGTDSGLSLTFPGGLAVADGILYVADTYSNQILGFSLP